MSRFAFQTGRWRRWPMRTAKLRSKGWPRRAAVSDTKQPCSFLLPCLSWSLMETGNNTSHSKRVKRIMLQSEILNRSGNPSQACWSQEPTPNRNGHACFHAPHSGILHSLPPTSANWCRPWRGAIAACWRVAPETVASWVATAHGQAHSGSPGQPRRHSQA